MTVNGYIATTGNVTVVFATVNGRRRVEISIRDGDLRIDCPVSDVGALVSDLVEAKAWAQEKPA